MIVPVLYSVIRGKPTDIPRRAIRFVYFIVIRSTLQYSFIGCIMQEIM